MADTKRPERVLPDEPAYRPLERFWPYAELSEQPSDEELAAIHPEVRDVLFGERLLPFSISFVFPAFDGERYAEAVALASASDEYVAVTTGSRLVHRARFFPSAHAPAIHRLYELVGDVPGFDVLIDDRPVPYARELWLPLVWCLIS
jgi:hypothetical protein